MNDSQSKSSYGSFKELIDAMIKEKRIGGNNSRSELYNYHYLKFLKWLTYKSYIKKEEVISFLQIEEPNDSDDLYLFDIDVDIDENCNIEPDFKFNNKGSCQYFEETNREYYFDDIRPYVGLNNKSEFWTNELFVEYYSDNTNTTVALFIFIKESYAIAKRKAMNIVRNKSIYKTIFTDLRKRYKEDLTTHIENEDALTLLYLKFQKTDDLFKAIVEENKEDYCVAIPSFIEYSDGFFQWDGNIDEFRKYLIDRFTPLIILDLPEVPQEPPVYFEIKLTLEKQEKLYNELKAKSYICPTTKLSYFCYVFGNSPIPDEDKPFIPIKWIKTNSTTNGTALNKRALLDLLELLGVPNKQIRDKKLLNSLFTNHSGKFTTANYVNTTKNYHSEHHDELKSIVSSL